MSPLIRNLGSVLGAYTLCRLLFLTVHIALYRDESARAVVEALIQGARFDLAVIALVNSPWALAFCLPVPLVRQARAQHLLKVWFIISNVICLGLNIMDVEYVKFTGTRLTHEILSMGTDVVPMIGHYVLRHWLLALTVAGFAILLHKLYAPSPVCAQPGGRIRRWLVWVSLLPLTVLALRGGLQLKPLRPGHAFVGRSHELAILALNSPFTFLYSLKRSGVSRRHFFASDREAAAQIPPAAAAAGPARRDNVVIIIVESLASEYMGWGHGYAGFTPFLDSLAATGVCFTNHYANGRRSIEAVSAILAGLPALMDDAFINSRYQANRIPGLGSALAESGYHTSFFHGGRNGTMSFDALARKAGFEHYFGKDQYPYGGDFDGHWGIFDGPYLQYFARQLDTFPEPFLSAVLTLSSHPPYDLPDAYRHRFPEGDLEIHASIGYVDHALREFFATVASMDWYAHTLFIITADHTQQSSRPEYQNLLGSHDVPLILYHPTRDLRVPDVVRTTQHADIPATVLDYLKLGGGDRYLFGRSLWGPGPGLALLYDYGQYRLVLDAWVVRLDGEGRVSCFSVADDREEARPLPPTPQLASWASRLKAYVQLFDNGMLDNRLAPGASAVGPGSGF